MISLSSYPFKTQKTIPTVSENRSTGLLLQAGFIRQELAGAYHFLHFWLRVINKIENIIRQEINAVWATEILMSSLGSRESWMKTGRWDSLDVLFKLDGAGERQYALCPTHEESVTPLMNEFIRSYKDLNELAVYQFQTKFRNEPRAKSGLLRGREFLMKDLYSFHKNQEDLDIYFEKVRAAYVRIYDRLGIGKDTYYTFASGGSFSKYSHEFQTRLAIGEDIVYQCKDCGQTHNKELVEEIFVCAHCHGKNAETFSASEVGNIFKLGTKYSNSFGLKYTSAEGTAHEIVMGCYGIGVSRLMGVIAEMFADERWLVWPESIAPASHYVIVLGDNLAAAKKLAFELEANGHEVILDDRDTGFWAKAGDADLLGIPYRIIVSDKTIAAGGYELKARADKEGKIVIWK